MDRQQECRNCPINECTGDGIFVGRCWHTLKNGNICPSHGDVKAAVENFIKTGGLTKEKL